jgi:uncharacterized protein with NAD-binding domain and iron-sulfur cluster
MAAETPPKKKIAILGGGIGGLVAAFELTSPPDWRDRFESVTVHQLGWRLGGKCASSRGPNGRIEEHGIHGFLGSYYNALPLMAACYDELGRAPGQPLASFEEALLPENFGLLWEWIGGAVKPWPQRFPTNTHSPRDRPPFKPPFERAIAGVIEGLAEQLAEIDAHAGQEIVATVQKLIQQMAAALAQDVDLSKHHALIDLIDREWNLAKPLVYRVAEPIDDLRRLFFTTDFMLTLVSGALKDDVQNQGYDGLDAENFSDWLTRHGAHPATVSSPLSFNYINMTYQYPEGDTTQPPRMAAGCYVRWALQAAGYMGSFIWRFAAGTGETVIAPLYLVLKQRGVKFEFFHKVEALRLSDDKSGVAAVDIAVQATLKDPAAGYDPLIDVKGLPCWPPEPRFDQLVQGEALKATPDLDLESWWTPWRAPEKLTLKAGEDYDHLVFAISVGAVPHVCGELMAASQAWRDMVDRVPALITQAMQIWVSKDLADLGWTYPLRPGETVLATTYLNPQNGHAEFHDLVPFEDWPADQTPKGLWYFCGLMVQDEPEPSFDDHDYPRRQRARVKYQSIQYLQAGIAPLIPGATTNASDPPGDPFGFNFDLLVDTRAAPAKGTMRFDSQFWRANIDPTERYVATPPGSTAYRLKAWGSGFDNLALAGDWIYSGVNVGSVEGTVMSGKLAAHAVCGIPPLSEIVGYPEA